MVVANEKRKGSKQSMTRKRWKDIYSGDNPFGLPQSVVREVRSASTAAEPNGHAAVKYLWIYVSHEDLKSGTPGSRQLDVEEWLGVIDESSAHGVEHVIISIGGAPSQYPDAIEIAKWAQSAHRMLVGLHVYGAELSSDDVEAVSGLEPSMTSLFVESGLDAAQGVLANTGIPAYPALGQDQEVVSPTCRLPEEMACVGASGGMYTCGLVLGDNDYHFGHFYARKLDDVMTDQSLPHTIPEGLPKKHHRCNGCPPLMIQRMREGR